MSRISHWTSRFYLLSRLGSFSCLHVMIGYFSCVFVFNQVYRHTDCSSSRFKLLCFLSRYKSNWPFLAFLKNNLFPIEISKNSKLWPILNFRSVLKSALRRSTSFSMCTGRFGCPIRTNGTYSPENPINVPFECIDPCYHQVVIQCCTINLQSTSDDYHCKDCYKNYHCGSYCIPMGRKSSLGSFQSYVHLVRTVHSAVFRHMLFGRLIQPGSQVALNNGITIVLAHILFTSFGMLKILHIVSKRSKLFRQLSSLNCSVVGASC